jgi:hypothetical protein
VYSRSLISPRNDQLHEVPRDLAPARNPGPFAWARRSEAYSGAGPPTLPACPPLETLPIPRSYCSLSYVAAGLPPAAILQAMTVNAARLLGVEKERGAIKPGLAADIIAVTGNPLEDPRVLRKVSFVMKDGKVIR